jgi:hypothetical protein
MGVPATGSHGSERRRDARKRVNHVTGLVLGVDEFVQEQTYLRERDHLAARSLHGYGTVAGLGVRLDHAVGHLCVAAGLAVDPAGHLICVPREQRIDLGDWMTRHRDAIAEAAEVPAGELPAAVTLSVVLCHRELETDPVPVPSPDRSVDEATIASRILDSFELDVRATPPGDTGELADGALHAAIDRLQTIASAHDDGGGVDGEAIRRELLAWATGERPGVADGACAAASDEGGEEPGDAPGIESSTAVLLAQVHVGIVEDGEGRLTPTDPLVDDGARPLLLTTRFLQEWLTALAGHLRASNGRAERPAGGRVLPLATVEVLDRTEGAASFLVWFHLDGPGASVVPVDDGEPLAYGQHLVIRTETCDAGRLRSTRIASNRVAVRQLACNRFQVDVTRREAAYLRFEFDLRRILLDNGQDLARFSEERGIGWVGQGHPDVVTVFVHNPSPERPDAGPVGR